MPYIAIYVLFTGRKSYRKLVVSFVTDGRKSPWLTHTYFLIIANTAACEIGFLTFLINVVNYLTLTLHLANTPFCA